jgi:hypothetical protein
VKLVERMPRVCKAVIRAKGGYFEDSEIYIVKNKKLWVTSLFHVLFDS